MKFEKRHISEQVLIYLRKKIMLQEFKEGDHLKESELSEELSISRGPIREAISKLEAEGLVITPSNGRTIVQKFGEKDIRNLYESRILLEIYALTIQNSEKLDNEGELLYQYIQEMEESLTGGKQSVEADLKFHQQLLMMTGNRTLIRLWNSLNEIIKTLIEVTSEFTAERQNEIVLEHKVIADALLLNNIEQAQSLLRTHLEGASDYYSKAVFELQGEGE
ncbi:transcriptional regulator, GntR family [Psychrobacillus psychrotolerans]|uniref:Transcriptional regulator, GntR family n=1 Tax=Psychrobacillus psychrotolerans TaxID=126156 RepID=A0A1I6ABV3_9BACI|nr:GntR family transcriptional regulator [Psychrobacillus psychrotolerans]SFQ66093.1 transcriptional regulator, GntR family [Psychrobacillus psychrotolerans]